MTSRPKKTLPKHVVEEADRHGNVRIYFRKGRGKRIRLEAKPGSDAFWLEYTAALAGKEKEPPKAKRTVQKGTFRALAVDYMASVEFRLLDQSTRDQRRRVIESMLLEPLKPGSADLFAEMPMEHFGAKHVKVLRDRKASAPEAANHRLKTLGPMFKWAIGEKLIETNFARDVPKFKTGSEGHHTWTVEEVELYIARHPLGTKAHLALALLLFSGQRISDVAQFGRQHLREDAEGALTIHFTQRKNRNRKPVSLALPVLEPLAEAIAAAQTGDLTFLVTEYGRGFSVKGLGNKFRTWCDEAGLNHCSAHGLRKAGATIAAENGATEHQLMAIFGWTRSEQATLYTRKARQRVLAGSSMHLIMPPPKNPSLSTGVDTSEGKTAHKVLKNNASK